MSRNSVSARVRQTTALSLALAVALAAWLGGSQARAGDTPPPPPPQRPISFCFPGTGDLVNGDLWIGTVHGEKTFPGINHATTKLIVRLREVRKRPLTVTDRTARCGARAAGYLIDLANENTQVEVTFDSHSCSGKSSTTYSEDPKQARGHIAYRNEPEPYRTGFGSRPRLEIPEDGVYYLTFHPPGSWTPRGCPSMGYGLQNDYLELGVIYRDPDPDSRRLTQNRSRMSGSYSVLENSVRWEARWDLCKAGTDGCSIVPPEGRPDACGNLAAERGLLDTLDEQRRAYLKQLVEQWQQFDETWAVVEANRADFEFVMRNCKLWEIARKATEFLIGRVGGPGDALVKARNTFKKMTSGDPIWVVGGLSYDDPTWKIEKKALTVAWKTVWKAYGELGESEPEILQHKLDKCAEAPSLGDDYLAAQKFVKAFGEAMAMLPGLQETLTKIEQKELEHWNRWHRYHQICLEYAACKGLAPFTCDPPPPARAPNSQP